MFKMKLEMKKYLLSILVVLISIALFACAKKSKMKITNEIADVYFEVESSLVDAKPDENIVIFKDRIVKKNKNDNFNKFNINLKIRDEDINMCWFENKKQTISVNIGSNGMSNYYSFYFKLEDKYGFDRILNVFKENGGKKKCPLGGDYSFEVIK